MNKTSFIELATAFYNKSKSDNHRYKSWEHCYRHFGSISNRDTACLHLAFYLASWGMYRGSSFLLQKDYQFFEPVVNHLLGYQFLRGLGIEAASRTLEDTGKKIIKLKNELQRIIAHQAGDSRNNPVSEILISKIMLGTLGCVPAYDRYVKAGFKAEGIRHHSFTEKSFKEIIGFGTDNLAAITEIRRTTRKNGLEYPDMKILDMYFWQIGFEKERAKT